MIVETTSCPEKPWEDLHYRPFSLQHLERTKHDESWLALGEEVDHHVLPLSEYILYFEENTRDIFPTILMNPRDPTIIEVDA